MSDERKMRAKVRVSGINSNQGTSENLTFAGVAKSDGPYPDDGHDENNSFARWSPSVAINILVANPALVGTFELGEEYYVDFIKVAPKPGAPAPEPAEDTTGDPVDETEENIEEEPVDEAEEKTE